MPNRLHLAKEIISLWKKFKIRKQKSSREIQKKLTIGSIRKIYKNFIYYRNEIERLETEFNAISVALRNLQWTEIKRILNRLKRFLKQLLEERKKQKFARMLKGCQKFAIKLTRLEKRVSQQTILKVNSSKGMVFCAPRDITILLPLLPSLGSEKERKASSRYLYKKYTEPKTSNFKPPNCRRWCQRERDLISHDDRELKE